MKKLLAFLVIALQSAQAASLLTVGKTPFEAFNCSVDFTAVAGTDGITLIGVVAKQVQGGGTVTSTLIAASPPPAVVGMTDVVVFRIQAGTSGQNYTVGVRVQDKVTSEIFEGVITVAVNPT
jgi:hypothetical protein